MVKICEICEAETTGKVRMAVTMDSEVRMTSDPPAMDLKMGAMREKTAMASTRNPQEAQNLTNLEVTLLKL